MGNMFYLTYLNNIFKLANILNKKHFLKVVLYLFKTKSNDSITY